ncbi:hypothetical protein [Abyssalbus ytuae]|uniref:Uncharacterized protein n=1 Tax=Abyssalbus ytuae TaxID=2926907 RepID=A0A9E7CYF7_9FLAO|nr:hypothetical protein [Abyssalbus ytuae]UOB16600.1 hypothetical protein MQE35_12745 [Abyssalbus ytuae]
MAIEKITYPDKTNVQTDPDSIKKFFATEANEIKNKFNAAADQVDQILDILNIGSNRTNIGSFISLTVLQNSYPDGPENSNDYAIIDDGISNPQVATYNSSSMLWEISGYQENIIFVANDPSLPTTGQPGKLYISLDAGNIWYWDEGIYKQSGRKSPPTSQPQIIQQTLIASSDGQSVFTLSKPANSLIVVIGNIALRPSQYSFSSDELTINNASSLIFTGTEIFITIF